ncbi:helix-turn-helix domain-containing protein [Roseibium polysiphoniae]|uniref:AraC family transcriptional regulator n=1 Tax=Roseibium polysiphoniae TaxID=2571221 RepID=UPI003296F565
MRRNTSYIQFKVVLKPDLGQGQPGSSAIGAMPVLPISMFAALVLAYVWLRAFLARDTPVMVQILILACAIQSMIISFNQHYEVSWLGPVQPVTAMVFPALAYLAFASTAIRPLAWKRDWFHVLGPVAGAICFFTLPDIMDGLVVASYVGYAVLLLRATLSGADALPLIRLEHGDRPLVLWRVVGLALLASAFSDVVIIAIMATGQEWLRPWVISIFSSGVLLMIGVLNLSDMLKDTADKDNSTSETASGARQTSDRPQAYDADPDLFTALEDLMKGEKIYLDPNLTLGRIARRLKVPEKLLSATINGYSGVNVSRYINTFRIEHACQELKAGANVTSAMYASGFNTKSNFNREFLRVKGCPPSTWLDAA